MSFVAPLLEWYAANARILPWRSCPSPYRTWVSEVMLQQTQVDTVLAYFNKWMARFPDLETLASADETAVLSLWEGLGYYSRARNLLQAARLMMRDMQGQIPSTTSTLVTLPGVGPYTAAAIASIAFGEDVAAVDGNIRRVFSRYFDIQEPARSPEGEKRIRALAQAHLPLGRAGAYNQALMDLGAMICTPRIPVCDQCPIRLNCQARKLGIQEDRPVKLPRQKPPHLTVTAAVIRRNGRVLLAQRPPHGLLGGLWEFPGGTQEEQDRDLESCLQREIMEELGVKVRVGQPFGKYKHAYTHFKITLFAFFCELSCGEKPQPLASEALAWAKIDELSAYPMGKVDRQIALRLTKEGADGHLSN